MRPVPQIALDEIWKPVVGFPRYEVSNLGRVKALRVRGEPKMLKPSPRRNGGKVTWYAVNLGRNNMKRIHRLVLEAFVGPAPEGMIGCHNDGDPANNRLGNLRWDTNKANTADAIRHGTLKKPPTMKGEEHPQRKLTPAAVKHIRAQPQRRGVLATLARQYGVSGQTILRVRRGDAWREVGA